MGKFKWTKEKVAATANKFSTRSMFKHNRRTAYEVAEKNNWLDEVCMHMKKDNESWSKQKIKVLARTFQSRTEFKQNHPSAYAIARTNNWIEEVCNHMTPLNKRWSNEMLKKEALKYKTRVDFNNASASAVTIARTRGIYDEICSHMDSVGNYLKRMVYAYEFSDKAVYIGLTYNQSERHKSHMARAKSPVYKHMKQTGLQPTYNIISAGYVDADSARELEGLTIEQYKNDGWLVLNSVKAGGLGGTLLPDDFKWTFELCKEVSSKYKRRVDFFRANTPCYSFAYKRGWLNEICSHMSSRSMTKEECTIEAKKYKTITQFIKGSFKAYNRAFKKKWLNEICSHMKRYTKWNEKLITIEAKKYTSRVEFCKKSPSAYGYARNKKLLDKACAHMNYALNYWSLEKVLKEVNKVSSMKEFRINAPKAYEAARHNGWIDKIWEELLHNNPMHRKRPISHIKPPT
jgi:hypothetical protein